MELGLKRTYVLLAPASIPLPFMFFIINARNTAFALLFLTIIATIIFLYMTGKGIMKTTLERHKEIHKGRIL
jgi:polyferredoxin